MALASEADSTETAENYEQLSFDELEKRKEQAEKDHSELKDKLNQARDALKTKEDEAKGPLEEDEKRKLVYEELDAKAKGMNKNLKEAITEFKKAETNANIANSILRKFNKAKDKVEKAKQRINYVKAAATRQTLAENELRDCTKKCDPLDAIGEYDLEDEIEAKAKAEKEAKMEQEALERLIKKCTTSCETLKGMLLSKNTDLETAENEHKKAKADFATFTACPDEKAKLIAELDDLRKIMADQPASIAKETGIHDKYKADTELPKYANVEENQVTANEILLGKIAAKEAAESTREYTHEQDEKARIAALRAQLEWRSYYEWHKPLVKEIDGLQTALKELEAKFAKDEERVGALQQVYQKKLRGKDPGNRYVIDFKIHFIFISCEKMFDFERLP